MRRKGMFAALAAGAAALAVAAYALAGGSGPGFNHLSATLGGYQETPSISSTGTANFTADVAKDGQSVDWKVSYAALEGNIAQSHIHFGQRGVAGGISVFLCTNLGNGPAGTQLCPGLHDGTISGTFRPVDVIGPAAQGITAGEWDELMNAIDAGKAYANIHSNIWPAGEIRAQLNETGNPHD
jgi:CHRD domain-containing protein